MGLVMETKFCKRCEKHKTLDNFYWHNTHKSYRTPCKECTQKTETKRRTSSAGRAKLREWYQNNKESHAASREKYYKTDKGRKTLKKYREKIAKNGKRKVWAAVSKAEKNGLLIRKNMCSACNYVGNTHFHHHHGYASGNELNVIELCEPCHKKEHRHSLPLQMQ